ncbi:MAG: methyltransferase domain-containing protein, partial [Thermoleophilia bacterium]|nr:methyltransferase domain-containing protein [Thermoleophilia bacterium]
PFAAHCADAVVSFNGLHCMPDHEGFLRSMRRILRPGASAFITTLVATRSPRHRAVAAMAQQMGILPSPPPTHDEVVARAAAAGFTSCTSLGGRGIAAFQLTV